MVEVASGTVRFPWRLDPDSPGNAATRADNAADNVEQVLVRGAGAFEQQLGRRLDLADVAQVLAHAGSHVTVVGRCRTCGAP